jgi:hypothetical protein
MNSPYSFTRTSGEQELVIDRFAGVDFSTHPTKVDCRRSPAAKNMIADEAYFPVKRTGYKRLFEFGDEIYGIYRFVSDNKSEFMCHSGNKLYSIVDGVSKEVYSNMAKAPSCAFTMGGKLYILDGKTYLTYDKATVRPVSEVAFVPTTTIGALPDGGGTAFENVNLLTPKRINTFVGDGTSKAFKLDAENIDGSEVTASVNDAAVTAFTVDRTAGRVTFSTPPSNGGGLANVKIAFSKTVAGNADKINKCRFFGFYGGQNDTRVFLSGNPNEKNTDWQSGLYEPAYFPDLGYTKVGADSSAIMGYVRQYDAQIVIKEGNGQDATQYLRTFEIDASGKAVYPLRQGAEGPGAVNYRCIATLEDTPLFLSSLGVFAVTGTNVGQQRSTKCVSRRINTKLLSENLKNAVACEGGGKYYLCIDKNCYVADSRQTKEDGQLEWYFWDNIPASAMCEYDGLIYFGTKDGKLMRFCKPDESDAYMDDGKAIDAYWSTPFSPLGSWASYKTVLNFYPVLMPYSRSGVQVLYNTDEVLRDRVLEENLDIFSFDTMDFSRFTFKTIATATTYSTGKRARRILLFQGVVKNDRIDEPFGLLAIRIRFRTNRNIY